MKKIITKTSFLSEGGLCLLCCLLTRLRSDGQQRAVHILGKDAVAAGWVIDKNMSHTMIPMETYQDCIEYYTICEETHKIRKRKIRQKDVSMIPKT